MIVTTKLTLPYVFTRKSEIRSRNGRTMGRTYVDVGTVTDDLVEVSISDAPVAVRWRAWTHNDMWRGGRTDPVTIEVRHYDGGFYLPLAVWDGSHARRDVPGVISKRDLGKVFDHRSRFDAQLADAMYAKMPKFSADEFKVLRRVFSEGGYDPEHRSPDVLRTIETGEAEGEKAASAFIGDLLLVKREVWIKVSEPKLAVLRSFEERSGAQRIATDVWVGEAGFGDPTWRGARWSRDRIGGLAHARFFGLHERQLLEDAASDMGMVVEPGQSSLQFGPVEVLMPQTLSFDREENEIARLSACLVDNLASELGHLDGVSVASWLAVRDAYEDWNSDGDPGHLWKALELVHALVDFMPDAAERTAAKEWLARTCERAPETGARAVP